jgi:elongation factor 2
MYQETITCSSPLNLVCKSPNKHNSIFVSVEPLPLPFQNLLSNSDISWNQFNVDEKMTFMAEYKSYWNEPIVPQQIWCFGGNVGRNALCDRVLGVAYMSEIKDYVTNGFQWVSGQGPLCEEPLTGVQFWINDVILHADAIHRGAGQLISTARRVANSAILNARPTINEPMYEWSIVCTTNSVAKLLEAIETHHGRVIDNGLSVGSMITIKAIISVSHSIGFDLLISTMTKNGLIDVFATPKLSHWESMNGENMYLEHDSVGDIIRELRIQKGLSEWIPSRDAFK